MIRLLIAILGWLAGLGVVGKVILAVSLFILWMIFWSKAFMGDVTAKIDALIVPSFPTTIDLSPLSFVNYVFPINEAINILIAIGALKIVAISIRIAKSWIPGVS